MFIQSDSRRPVMRDASNNIRFGRYLALVANAVCGNKLRYRHIGDMLSLLEAGPLQKLVAACKTSEEVHIISGWQHVHLCSSQEFFDFERVILTSSTDWRAGLVSSLTVHPTVFRELELVNRVLTHLPTVLMRLVKLEAFELQGVECTEQIAIVLGTLPIEYLSLGAVTSRCTAPLGGKTALRSVSLVNAVGNADPGASRVVHLNPSYGLGARLLASCHTLEDLAVIGTDISTVMHPRPSLNKQPEWYLLTHLRYEPRPRHHRITLRELSKSFPSITFLAVNDAALSYGQARADLEDPMVFSCLMALECGRVKGKSRLGSRPGLEQIGFRKGLFVHEIELASEDLNAAGSDPEMWIDHQTFLKFVEGRNITSLDVNISEEFPDYLFHWLAGYVPRLTRLHVHLTERKRLHPTDEFAGMRALAYSIRDVGLIKVTYVNITWKTPQLTKWDDGMFDAVIVQLFDSFRLAMSVRGVWLRAFDLFPETVLDFKRTMAGGWFVRAVPAASFVGM